MSKTKQSTVYIESRRITGIRDAKIYGHFLEHFHRQIYGGIIDPESPLSNEKGFRLDVIHTLKDIQPAVIRWPGGCFVSAYHWKDGIGIKREPAFDKAWRVEESNIFGTDEYMEFCKLTGSEPYICTNADSGTQEEMSDWVEYCNQRSEGKWAKLRIENGHPEPFNVKYWSIGNENYGSWEIGAKSLKEWGRYVKEAAKMMKRVDPNIELLAPSISELDWNQNLLLEAGDFLDWISIHHYWDQLWQDNKLSSYETCMAYTLQIQDKITKTRNILGALGYIGKIRIAFDEWNLRGWHHPNIDSGTKDYLLARDKNDINSSYTMADAVFSACFLNSCLRNCDVVGMANFAPTVNTRGAIYTYKKGIILRTTYFVFELYTKYMGDTVIDTWLQKKESFTVTLEGKQIDVPVFDVIATKDSRQNGLSVAIINRHPDKTSELNLEGPDFIDYSSAVMYSISGASKDSFNDIKNPSNVKIKKTSIQFSIKDKKTVEVLPHSVNILVFSTT